MTIMFALVQFGVCAFALSAVVNSQGLHPVLNHVVVLNLIVMFQCHPHVPTAFEFKLRALDFIRRADFVIVGVYLFLIWDDYEEKQPMLKNGISTALVFFLAMMAIRVKTDIIALNEHEIERNRESLRDN